MVSKKILSELHLMSWIILALGVFMIMIPYIYKVSTFAYILGFTIVGAILIKLAIVFRNNLRLDKFI